MFIITLKYTSLGGGNNVHRVASGQKLPTIHINTILYIYIIYSTKQVWKAILDGPTNMKNTILQIKL